MIRKQGFFLLFSFFISIFLFSTCTFDYGDSASSGDELPSLIMENVDYIRVKDSDPIARFQAERAERYEKRRVMELMNFSFEQFSDSGNTVNASGIAGNASVEIDSGDIRMGGGVKLEVESEDIFIETHQLDWIDEERILFAGEDDFVYIYQSNGANLTGFGFIADARRRTWNFSGSVSGTYVYDDNDEEPALEEPEYFGEE
jgi:LPS export ABC transporter protein LptC